MPKTGNMAADALYKLASSSTFDMKHSVMIEILLERSIDPAQRTVNAINQRKEWYDNIISYKLEDSLLED